MDVASLVLASAALALSIASMTIAVRLNSSLKRLAKARGLHLPSRAYRRVKRYVLLKVVCLDGDVDRFAKELTQRIYSALGPTLMARCGIALAAYRRDLGRAIVRVSGDPSCVKHLLLALSMLHVLEDSKCLAIPLRASGCLTRLRKALRVYRASG